MLLDFLRPADRETLRTLGKEIEDDPSRLRMFVVSDVDKAYRDGTTSHEAYTHDWLTFYDPHEIADRQARWRKAEAARAAAERQRRAEDHSGLLLKAPPAAGAFQRGGVGQGRASFSAPAVPRIGRNDPCPCGSGRKYKKCHGA